MRSDSRLFDSSYMMEWNVVLNTKQFVELNVHLFVLSYCQMSWWYTPGPSIISSVYFRHRAFSLNGFELAEWKFWTIFALTWLMIMMIVLLGHYLEHKQLLGLCCSSYPYSITHWKKNVDFNKQEIFENAIIHINS